METVFDVRKVLSENDSFSEPEQEDFTEVDRNFTHLTSLIRNQYFNYLKNILEQNYNGWKGGSENKANSKLDDEILANCAAYFEERAVRYCMVVQLYRKYMLRVISEIRHETSRCKLIPKLKEWQARHVNETRPKTDQLGKRIEVICNSRNEQQRMETVEDFPHCNEWISLANNGSSQYPKAKDVTDCNLSYNTSYYVSEFPNQFGSQCHEIEVPSAIVESINLPQHGLTHNQDYNDNIPSTDETDLPTLSLQEKIAKFQQHLDERERQAEEIIRRPLLKRKLPVPPTRRRKSELFHQKLSISHPISPVSTSSDEEDRPAVAIENAATENPEAAATDTVFKDLEDLFAEEKTKNDEITEIFGDGTYNPEIDLILREIEKAQVPGTEETGSTTTTAADSRKAGKRYRLQPLICDLRQSLWPCELHMWKQRLRDTLSQITEIDIRYHEVVQRRFRELFDDDSEDEFAPYSPSVELDEILIASCMKRIAPVIVKYLMRPMKEGRIANRYLFKRLAKKLANSIIMINQYPDENFIKDRVESFFCVRDSVTTIEDTDVD